MGQLPPARPRPRRPGACIPISSAAFIRAETIAFEDYVAFGGERGAKEAGRMRAEGRDYVVQDGDRVALPVQPLENGLAIRAGFRALTCDD